MMTVVYQFDVIDLNFSPTAEYEEVQFFSLDQLREQIDDFGLQVRPLVKVFRPCLFQVTNVDFPHYPSESKSVKSSYKA